VPHPQESAGDGERAEFYEVQIYQAADHTVQSEYPKSVIIWWEGGRVGGWVGRRRRRALEGVGEEGWGGGREGGDGLMGTRTSTVQHSHR
jgi:hypothetical protein